MDDEPKLGMEWLRWMRVVILAGIPVGLLVGGVGSRLAMLLLRVTSPEAVTGVESDDGFIIGRFTLSGTYALLQLGAFVGVVGAMLYLLVRPWLLGPNWFRYVTIGLGCGAVVGSMLLHSDGIDFLLLKPPWLAMGLFVALPALFGVTIGPALEMAERYPMPAGWRKFAAPAVVLAIGPGGLIPMVFVAPVVFVYAAVRTGRAAGDPPTPPVLGLIARVAWLAIALIGLIALVGDIRAINRLH